MTPTDADRRLIERNRHKLRMDDFAEVTLDGDDIKLMQRHCPDMAKIGYRKGDRTQARMRTAIYTSIIETDQRTKEARAEARKERVEEKARGRAAEQPSSRLSRALSNSGPGRRKPWLRRCQLSRPKEIAEEFAENDAEFISLDADCKGDARALLRQVWMIAGVNMLLARERAKALEARIAELERRPIVFDDGIWSGAKTYGKGAGVTYGGSFWISQIDNNKSKPGSSDDWRLAVKKGRDGKDANQ